MKKKSTGRPSKYKIDYCKKLIQHCAKGHSFETFAAAIGVTSRTVRNWAATDPVFAEACENAKVAALYFFERQLLSGIGGRSKKNTALLIFALKTRFHEVYGQPKIEIEAQVEVDPPGTFEFKGRKVTVADLDFDELEEANKHLKEKIKETDAKIYALENDPDPLTECESSFL